MRRDRATFPANDRSPAVSVAWWWRRPRRSVPRSASRPSEWRYFGGNKAFTRYSPLDQINRDNVKNLRIVWRRPAVSDQLTQAFPDLQGEQLPAVDADRHRRHALHPERPRPGRRLRRRERQDRVGAGAVRADARGGERVGRRAASTTGAAAPATPTARIFAIRGEYLYALDAETGKPVAGFGDQGRASLHFEENQPLAGALQRQHRPARRRQRRRRHRQHRRRGRHRHVQEGSGARGRPRLRCAERQAALDVPRRAAAGRIRQRHLGQRVVEDRRRSRRVESDDRRRGARLRLHPADVADRRRRTASGGPATTCSPTRSSRSTRRPASASGTSRRFTTISGNGRTSARRCSATSRSTAGGSRR